MKAVPCSSVENIQPKGQVDFNTAGVWELQFIALQAVLYRGRDHCRALARSLFQPSRQELFPEHNPISPALVLTFFPPGEDVSGGGVLVMFRGLEPQLEGDDPLILKHP